MNMNIPANMVSVSTSIAVGGVTYTTTLNVQTYRQQEIAAVIDMAWDKTREAWRQASIDAARVLAAQITKIPPSETQQPNEE